MAIAVNALTGGDDTGASIVTPSITPGANCLGLAALVIGSTGMGATTLSGNGLTWVQIFYNDISPNAGALYRAMVASPSAGAVTITLPGSVPVAWSIVEFSGVDTTGTNGSGAIAQGNAAFAASTMGLLVTLGAFSNLANATYGAFMSREASNTPTVGAGFTQAHQLLPGGPRLLTEYLLGNDQTVDESNNVASDTLGYALEIKADVGAPVPLGAGGTGIYRIARRPWR